MALNGLAAFFKLKTQQTLGKALEYRVLETLGYVVGLWIL